MKNSNCIVTLAWLGFASTLREIRNIREVVTGYVNINEKEMAQKTFYYKNLLWPPRKRNNRVLSFKKCYKTIKTSSKYYRKPLHYQSLVWYLRRNNWKFCSKKRPDLIWNTDESGALHEPKKCKAESLTGQSTLQIIIGSHRGNATILMAVSNSGETLPPLIIFQGKQIQTTWRPSTKPDHQFYPWIYANVKGWMKSDIFYKWFLEWEKMTRSFTSDEVLEERLMIYDGHLSYLGFPTLQCEREWKVMILKLSLHTMDVL